MGSDIVFLEAGAEVDREALKERAATVLERGLGFVERHGDAVGQLRTLVLLEARPREALLAALEARQGSDGSHAPLGLATGGALGFEDAASTLPAPLLGTLEALAVLGDAGALHASGVAGAEAFLRGTQREDGSWGGGDDAAARLFATGMLGGFLGRTRVVRPAVLAGAGAFLTGLWSPERVEEGRWSALCAFAHFFTNVHHELADEALQWCGRELERGFRSRRFDALATLRVLVYCDAAALPGARFDAAELLEALLAEQAADGGFAELSGGGATARVAPTHDAMLSILRLCRVL